MALDPGKHDVAIMELSENPVLHLSAGPPSLFPLVDFQVHTR